MTKAEEKVIRAAIALCKAGHGFCFKDDGKINSVKLGKRLEYAVCELTATGKWRKK